MYVVVIGEKPHVLPFWLKRRRPVADSGQAITASRLTGVSPTSFTLFGVRVYFAFSPFNSGRSGSG